MTRILIANGRIIDPSNGIDRKADLLIEDGAFVEVTTDRWEADEVIDATSLVVCPGFVDLHVHLREPGGEGAETLQTGLAAAVAGGFTTVACMPNTTPAIDSADMVRHLARKGAGINLARLRVIAAMTAGREGKKLADLAALNQAGAVAFSDDGSPVADEKIMEAALTAAGRLGRPVVSHCEGAGRRGSMHEGAVSRRLGLAGIGRAGEYEMVEREIGLAARTGGHTHIAHVSVEESVKAIRDAKRRGVRVTAEATPHHLVLTDEAIKEPPDPVFKVNPPLRERRDVEALREGLADGTIDAIACDHAPHEAAAKSRPFAQAPFGMIGLESVLPVMVTHLVDTGIIPIGRLIELLTIGPARAFGLECGAFDVGRPADVTLFDPAGEYTIDAQKFKSKSRNCPFDGWKVRGRVVKVLVDGRVTYSA